MAWRFLGVTTKRLYSFMANPLPQGSPTVTINGETCVPTNNDGSLARGAKGPPTGADIYGFSSIPSPWEMQ